MGEPKHTPKKWAYMGRNWYELTGVYLNKRQQENELFTVMRKMNKFESKNDDISRRKYALIAMLSAICP